MGLASLSLSLLMVITREEEEAGRKEGRTDGRRKNEKVEGDPAEAEIDGKKKKRSH